MARQKRAQLLAASGVDLGSLAEAVRSVDGVPIEPQDKATLLVSVFENALAWISAPGRRPDPSIVIAGHPGTERGIREGLEEAYRRLAQVTDDSSARIALVDKANSVRPWTLR